MSRYKIKNIEKVNPPEGASAKRWYQYIIANDINTITRPHSDQVQAQKKM